MFALSQGLVMSDGVTSTRLMRVVDAQREPVRRQSMEQRDLKLAHPDYAILEISRSSPMLPMLRATGILEAAQAPLTRRRGSRRPRHRWTNRS